MSRPLFVIGSWRLYKRERLLWSKADRERSRWVRDVYRLTGWTDADYVVLSGYTMDQSQAWLVAKRRGFVQFSQRQLVAPPAPTLKSVTLTNQVLIMLNERGGPMPADLHGLVARQASPGAWALALAAHRMGVLPA